MKSKEEIIKANMKQLHHLIFVASEFNWRKAMGCVFYVLAALSGYDPNDN